MTFRKERIGDLALVIAQRRAGRMKTFIFSIAKATCDQTGPFMARSRWGAIMITTRTQNASTFSLQVERFATTRSAASGPI